MTRLPSKVHSGICGSSSTRNLKCVPRCFRSLSWSDRYESCGRAVVVVPMIEYLNTLSFRRPDVGPRNLFLCQRSALCVLLRPLWLAGFSVGIKQYLARLSSLQPVHAFAEVCHRHAVSDH